MRNRLRTTIIASAAAAVVAVGMSFTVQSVEGQQGYQAPQTADGKPDLNGIWQAVSSAHFDVEPHAARFGPVVEMAAHGAIPGGLGIVQGGEIPYRPEARAKQHSTKAQRSGVELQQQQRASASARANAKARAAVERKLAIAPGILLLKPFWPADPPTHLG